MGKYDFDCEIDRHGSCCAKVEALDEFFGRHDLQAMWIADMDFGVCPEITQALARRISHPVFGYPAVPESYWTSIISWLSRRHGFEVARHEIAFVPGVVRGVAFAINFFSEKGDKIVIQPPVYHPFKRVIEANGRVVVENPLIWRDDAGYEMDIEGLERIFATEKPKMMILCNPHNPVGLQWSIEQLAQVGRLAKKYGVKVISDEIHGDLMLFGKPHFPFAMSCKEAAEVAITFGAPSKTFNIPGLVSSWCVVGNHELREPFFAWMEMNEFSSPTLLAMVATEAAYNNGEQWLSEALEYIEGNLHALAEFVEQQMPKVKMVMPQASFLAWLDFRGLGLSHDELWSMLTDGAHVAFNDGVMFGTQAEGFMRVNVAMPRKQLLEAFGRIASVLSPAEVSSGR